MKVGIMQPYFFPYIGYWSLIKQTEHFILFDSVQFIKHGWIERNRILKPGEGSQYIKVPLEKYSRSTRINEIRINDNEDWRDKLFRQLEHYKKRAPFYSETIGVVQEALNIQTDSMVKLNENIILTVCKYLDIDVKLDIFSEMNLKIEEVNEPDEWALNICKAMGNVNEYWNPEGGLEFFNKSKYIDEGINIKFLKIKLERYSQRRESFEAGLSIIDVMMFNSKEKVKEMLNSYTIL